MPILRKSYFCECQLMDLLLAHRDPKESVELDKILRLVYS